MKKILTFQHKSVLDKINEGVYKCDILSKYYNNTPKCYKMLRDRLRIDHNPIFGWAKVLEEEININQKTIKRCLEMTEFDSKDYVLLELNIPDKFVDLQNFYMFVDARCEEEGIDPYYENFEDFPFDVIFEFEENEEIQATFPEIRKEWIENIYSFNDKCEYELYE